MAEKSASGGKDGGAKWPTFPGDNPTLVALDVYLRHFNEELQSIEAAYVIAGKTPPSLIGLAGAVDTSALVKIAEPTTRAEIDADTVKAKIDRTKFNSYCDERIRAEKAREERFDAGIADIKSQLATIICNTMRDSAPVLLRALKKETQMGTSGTMFDGVAMYNKIVAMKSEPGPTQDSSAKWHEGQYMEMDQTPLHDHCSAEDFMKKVNKFLVVHLPNFDCIKLSDAQLGKKVIEWMPACLASDGRGLKRSLEERQAARDSMSTTIAAMPAGPGKVAAEASLATMPYGIANYEQVFKECIKIVSSSADQTVENARMTAAAMPSSTAAEVAARDVAIAAAATMLPGGVRPTPAPAGGPTAAAAAATATAEAEAKKQRKEKQQQELLAAAARRAEKEENKKGSKLLPAGQYCKWGSCRWAHAEGEQCWAYPGFEGPLPPDVQKNADHVKRIEKRRDAACERMYNAGQWPTKTPKKLKTGTPPTKPGAMAAPPGLGIVGPDVDPDPMGDGLGLGGRLTFEGEPGFARMAAPALASDAAASAADALTTQEQLASQGLDDDAFACEECEGDWYALIDHTKGGEPTIFNVQSALELDALLAMSTDESRAGELELFAFGKDVDGHDELLAWQKEREEQQLAHARAELAKVAKAPPKPVANVDDHATAVQRASPALAAAAMRGAGDPAGRAELELAIALEQAAGAAEERAPQRPEESPPKQLMYPSISTSGFSYAWYVVFGGPFEGVHMIFDVDTELRPLLTTPDARAFGPSEGIMSRELAEAKLRALVQARKAEQWRSMPIEEGDDEVVPMGERIKLTYPQGRQAVAALTPESALRDIRDVIKGAELPIAMHVGGGSPSRVSPGKGRNKLDLLVEARQTFNMAIPSEWGVNVVAGSQEVTAESPQGATVRANAVSPVTLIPARAPPISDRQVSCFLLMVCIVLLAIVVPLAMGVSFYSAALSMLMHMGGARGVTEGYHLTEAVNGTMAVAQPRELDPMTVFYGTSLMFTAMAIVLHVLFECGFHDTTREFMARMLDQAERAQRAVRRVPRIVRHVATGLGLSVTFTILFLLARGVDGHVTEGKVARTRSVVLGAPMPAHMRQLVLERAVQEHSIAVMPNHLSSADAVSLAGSLGIPAYNLMGKRIDNGTEATAAELARATVPRLNLLDSGAAVDTSDGVLERNGGYAVEGTRGANVIAVSTANGTVVPPEHVTNRIPVRRRDQSTGVLVRRQALIMDNCPHNLISVGALAAVDGYGFWLAPYAQESYLRPSRNPNEDIPFLNVGVAILPDADTAARSCMPTVARGTRGASKLDVDAVHRTFNGRSAEALRHLPDVAPDAPQSWRKMEKRACDPCETAKAKRVPLTGSAGARFDANKTVSCDDWSVSVGHMHGGQQVVGGYHHNGSGLNRFYLKHTKSGPETAKCTRLFFAWARTYCQWAITHFHADNAPNLIAGENEAACEELGVHVSSCAPYEPRGNSTIERPWRTWAEDIRSALSHANLTNCESLWWYAGRDANQKDWCIPIRTSPGKEIDGRKWTTKWELFTGHRPRVSQHYPFGCCAYMLTYHPKTKVAQKGVRCLNFGRAENQPGYLLFDGQRVHVSPHCVMMPWAFPGLRRKTGGGLYVPEPDEGSATRSATVRPPQQRGAPPPAPSDDDDDDVVGAGDGGAAREAQAEEDSESDMPRLVDIDDDDSDDDDDGDGGGGEGERISQRLGRANRGVRQTAHGSSDLVPGQAADTTQWVARQKADARVEKHKRRQVAQGADLERAVQRFDADLTRPFMIYVGSSTDRPGSLREHADTHGLGVLMVDPKVGGYEHDLVHPPVAHDLEQLLRHPKCQGMFVSIPCGTWSALRYIRPGPPVVRRLASKFNEWVSQVLGVPRADGSLPDSVVRANDLATRVAKLGEVAAQLGKDVAFECPVSRAKGSQFAIKGREDHAEMFTHPALAKLEADYTLRRVYFDQSMLGSEFEKTTQLIATPRLHRSLRPRFVDKVDTRGHVHKSLIGEVDADGTFASEAAAAYPSEMNRSIADAFAEAAAQPRDVPPISSLMPPSWPNSPVNTPRPTGPPSTPPNGSAPAAPAAAVEPMEQWRQWVSDVPLMPAIEEITDEAFRAAFQPPPLMHAQAAVRSAPGFFSEEFRWSGVDGQAFPLPVEEYAGDSPSYRESVADGPDRDGWAKARDDEMRNLANHDAFTEVPESELPTWNGRSATEVVNTLWVLKKKRGHDGQVTKFKARCVFDGRNQKAVAARMGVDIKSYAPCGRPSTHKALIATAVYHQRRHRTFDVTGAYLKGQFNETEVVYARPPPGERKYTIIQGRAVPVIWKLNVPLYGEVDAGYIWNRTATKQLVEVQGFSQSEYDPGYFWKVLADGTRMDLLLYVDDAYVTDDHSPLADAELETFGMAFKEKDGSSGITVQSPPKHFLGANVDVHSEKSVTISSRAYVTQMATRYLEKPLDAYPDYLTPCARDIVEAYDEAREKVDVLDVAATKRYASKCGAAIFAGPCSRFDALYVLGMCARCLTFPTERMNKAVDRVIAYLAKTAERGVTPTTPRTPRTPS